MSRQAKQSITECKVLRDYAVQIELYIFKVNALDALDEVFYQMYGLCGLLGMHPMSSI